MRHRPAFALSDLIAGMVVVAALLATTAATFADNRTARQQRQNATQLRGIHQGLFTFGNSNKEKYPGQNSRGDTIEDSEINTGNSGDGETTEARIWIMLDGNFFTPEYAIAPVDDRAVAYDPGTDPTQVPVTHEHYSHAMLDISTIAPARRAEWAQTLNTQAIVMSDRNCTDLNEDDPTSIWDEEAWAGHILWNDNHVELAADHIHETRYANGDLNVDEDGDSTDDLFTIDTNDASDALMTFSRDEAGNERAVPRVIEDEDE